MTIRWSPEASVDFAGIVEYIRAQNPSAADRVARSIYDSIASLANFPQQGRPGKVEGTRELVLTPLPFIVIYRLTRMGNRTSTPWITALAVVARASNQLTRPQAPAQCL